jgi:hypothetical protein
MPNPDPLITQYANKYSIAEERSKFENYLVTIRDECQKIIPSTCHLTYNERHQKIIEMIDWTLEKYKIAQNIQKMNEQVIIDNIIEELDKKREVAVNKKQKTLLKDELLKYSEEENTIDNVLFLIYEGTGKLC